MTNTTPRTEAIRARVADLREELAELEVKLEIDAVVQAAIDSLDEAADA